MLRSAKDLMNYTLQFESGSMSQTGEGAAKIVDYIFDDFEWLIRYLVVDMGGRNYILSTMAAGQPDFQSQVLPLKIGADNLANSPDIDLSQSFDRSHEIALSEHYGWPRYWENLDIPSSMPGDLTAIPLVDMELDKEPMIPTTGNENLGSNEDTKYLHKASDIFGAALVSRHGSAGKLDDFIILDENWDLPYLVVDTGGLLSGKKVLIAPSWVTQTDYKRKEVRVDLDKDVLHKAPEFNASEALNKEYWDNVTDYYGSENEA